MNNPADIRNIVDRFVAAFSDNDASAIPLTDDAVLSGPMLPQPVRGAEAVRRHIEEVAPFVSRLTLKRLVIEGDTAAVVIEFEGVNGVVIEGADFIRVRDGELCEDVAYFDTRPLLEGNPRA